MKIHMQFSEGSISIERKEDGCVWYSYEGHITDEQFALIYETLLEYELT